MRPLTGKFKTEFWHRLDDGRVVCDLCPRHCRLREGKKGACFVREALDGEIVLTSYGVASGFAIDPIEKKPLNQFYPGSLVYSFGTIGCNLSCKFCQNWQLSHSRNPWLLSAKASPEHIAEFAQAHGCRSVAFTYNDPVIFFEYVRDTAIACHQRGIKTVIVSAGYICEAPRKELLTQIDAANIDLKALSEGFYRRVCGGELAPVLDTLMYLKYETSVWLEITNLLIPGLNDSSKDIEMLSQWIVNHLGPDVPVHFSGFHPDFKMTHIDYASLETLLRARHIACASGLHFVYTGNIQHSESESTYCPHCHQVVIRRRRYQVCEIYINSQSECMNCHSVIPGRYV